MTQTDRIIQGGEDLFLKAGIKSVTMDDIAKHLGMFIDKVEHSGNVNVAFETVYEQRPAKA